MICEKEEAKIKKNHFVNVNIFKREDESVKAFMGDDFLLDSKTAVKLYREYAENMPIIDYHCHLSPKEIDFLWA